MKPVDLPEMSEPNTRIEEEIMRRPGESCTEWCKLSRRRTPVQRRQKNGVFSIMWITDAPPRKFRFQKSNMRFRRLWWVCFGFRTAHLRYLSHCTAQARYFSSKSQKNGHLTGYCLWFQVKLWWILMSSYFSIFGLQWLGECIGAVSKSFSSHCNP